MPLPAPNDLINFHTHDSVRTRGVFAVENLMMHEERIPDDSADAFSVGIHPWFLKKEDYARQFERLSLIATDERVMAIGEAGYDSRKGPDIALQRLVFEAQAKLASDLGKPLVIHCVKGYDELWASLKRLKPAVPWIIHGFNGSPEQANQLVEGGMYLSLWVKSVLSGSLAGVMKAVPVSRIFLETDGFEVEVKTLYEHAARCYAISVTDLGKTINDNYRRLFG
jgi:TatD DNase family protein